MELYIGGFAQGKAEYVLSKYADNQVILIDGKDCNINGEEQIVGDRKGCNCQDILVFNHFHHWIRRMLTNGENIEKQVEMLLHAYSEVVIICDEIGNGIVPMDAFEREYRERLGRILIQIAKEAERVERIICGMGQRIK